MSTPTPGAMKCDEQRKEFEPHVEWEIVLSGGHHDICVIVSAPENATDTELQSLAETEAMAKTYIWSKRLVRKGESK